MSTVRVRGLIFILYRYLYGAFAELQLIVLFSCSSVYQDIPLYSLDEFRERAPAEARTEEVLQDEHQLMLNRLSFELAERQRYVIPSAERCS